MSIEQIKPDKPNFGLVVALAGITILMMLVAACFFIKFDGKHLSFRHHSRERNSQLSRPAAETFSLASDS